MSYPPVRCFLLEPTDAVQRTAHWSAPGPCPAREGKDHWAERVLACGEAPLSRRFEEHEGLAPTKTELARPPRCACGFRFTAKDYTGHGTGRLWRRADDPASQSGHISDFGPGAMYRSYWHEPYWAGFDGVSWSVVLPNGHHWCIDSEASNCTRKGDKAHRCWVRTGTPPNLTVGKNGETCQAGAGSIMAGDYHGFLVRGWLAENPSAVPA